MSFSWVELKKNGNLRGEKDLTNSTSGCIVFKCQYICISVVGYFTSSVETSSEKNHCKENCALPQIDLVYMKITKEKS